jgi:hypothetical protein
MCTHLVMSTGTPEVAQNVCLIFQYIELPSLREGKFLLICQKPTLQS